MINKICSVCKIEKCLDDFHKARKDKNGRNSRCKKCACEASSAYRKKVNFTTPEYIKEIACTKCGELNPIDIYHKNSSVKIGVNTTCRKCNAKKAYNERRKNNIPINIYHPIINGFRVCKRCAVNKTIESFRTIKKSVGFGAVCKDCEKIERQIPVNKERKKTQYSNYKKENRQKVRESSKFHNAIKRARHKRSNTGLVTREVCEYIYATEYCTYCRKYTPPGKRECDHVTPLSKGGLHHPKNLVMACESCNSSKFNLYLSEWLTFRGKKYLPN